jgi:nucleotide-binding universal stress UspA family protein
MQELDIVRFDYEMPLSFVDNPPPARRGSLSEEHIKNDVRFSSQLPSRAETPVGRPLSGQFRLPSPPPPAKDPFLRRVAFDTFDNKEATDFSLTLRSKHLDYKYTRLSRTILIGVEKNRHSEAALEWLLEELVEDGDEVVCLRAIDPNSKMSSSDSALEERQYRAEAESFLQGILAKNINDKKISLIVEFPVGRVQDMIQRTIQIYEPAIFVVGTRGKSMDGFMGLVPGSVSKYCLQHSPVPVIVVRPSHKRAKKKAKREADPTRRAYRELLATSSSDRNAIRIYDQGSTGNRLPPQLPQFLQIPERSASRPQSVEVSRTSSPFERLLYNF